MWSLEYEDENDEDGDGGYGMLMDRHKSKKDENVWLHVCDWMKL